MLGHGPIRHGAGIGRRRKEFGKILVRHHGYHPKTRPGHPTQTCENVFENR